MLLSDRITGGFLAVLGAAAWYGGSRLPPIPGQQIGPNVFPMVVGAGLVFCGVLIALRVGATFEEEAEADLAVHQEAMHIEVPKETLLSRLKVLLPPLMLLFYVLVVDRLGFIPTAVVIIATIALALGASRKLALAVAVLAPPFVHLVFAKLLRVPLPAGLLPMPW